jgi:hypothetical protein
VSERLSQKYSRPDPCKEKKNAMSTCFRGLVLQDLTFVHIGNNDLLPEGSINFSKRWQQFNIVENMKRFKKGQVPHYSVSGCKSAGGARWKGQFTRRYGKWMLLFSSEYFTSKISLLNYTKLILPIVLYRCET